MPQTNSVRGLSSIKAISKYEVNQMSGFQDIMFTSNCGRMDRQMDRQTEGKGHSIIRPVFLWYKGQWFLINSLNTKTLT